MDEIRKTGRVTIPTDLDVVPETLEILKKWGADAVRLENDRTAGRAWHHACGRGTAAGGTGHLQRNLSGLRIREENYGR